MSNVDPVSIEVVGNYLVSAVREMNSTLRRTAYSTILRESMDSSTALFDGADDRPGTTSPRTRAVWPRRPA